MSEKQSGRPHDADSGKDHFEDDAPPDAATATSRATGGEPDAEAPDSNSTTGTTPNETFVGRVSGQDVGYAGETGAERRAAAAEQD